MASIQRERVLEDASKLNLGEDFQQAKRCLWYSEVAVILEERMELHEDQDRQSLGYNMFQKTFKYVNKFNNFKTRQALSEATQLMKQYVKDYGVDEFEIAVLQNLNIETAEEAKELIPTLKEKLNDDLIAELVADCKRYQNQ
eukprot:TRINITY_DN15907_c0_g1_i2.p1 TRINITY_DN15907_c0_g1~~TRINITY_DN15907_c0_g1_i2.p1  ORF type:complete len:142 (-),score=32.21 TRINITY_DN15907_c0_g1_i2:261-686(-)